MKTTPRHSSNLHFSNSKSFGTIFALVLLLCFYLSTTAKAPVVLEMAPGTKLQKHEIAKRKQFVHPMRHLLPNSVDTESSEVREIIMVDVPVQVDNKYMMFEQQILNHTYGNSWGSPGVQSYTPPPSDIDYNKILVTIETTSSGGQYDRLAHLFVNSVPVWRTSTAEPGGRNIHFNWTKDLSDYIAVFRESGHVSFQLDNVVSGSLNGEFAVSIIARYYKTPTPSSTQSFDMFADIPEAKALQIAANSPPTQILPIQGPISSEKPQIKYYPTDAIEYTVPQQSSDTIRCKLRLFVTGNAAEEFWYSNMLDPYKDKFSSHGNGMLGNGPVRVVKVYLDNQLVAVDVPPPVIYTGGISPSLWNPVVGLNAYDTGHIDIDLTAYLPKLWRGSSNLKVVVVAGAQSRETISQGDTIPGDNWIVAGSVMSWQDSRISDTSGTVVSSKNETGTLKQDVVVLGEWDPKWLKEIVGYADYVRTVTCLKYTISSSLNAQERVCFETFQSVQLGNVQSYKSYGDYASAVSNLRSIKRSEILKDGLQSSYSTSFGNVSSGFCTKVRPVVVPIMPEWHGNSKRSTFFENVYKTVFTTNTSHIDDQRLSLYVDLLQTQAQKLAGPKGTKYKLYKHQNGTSLFNLDPNGNYGSGATDTEVELKDFESGLEYERKVTAAQGAITSDNENSKIWTNTARFEQLDSSLTSQMEELEKKNRLKHSAQTGQVEVTQDDLMKMSENYCKGIVGFDFLKSFYTRDTYKW